MRESGVTLDLPSTVSGASGLTELFCDWVTDAWKHIQLEGSEWHFRTMDNATFTTVASQRDYDLTTDVDHNIPMGETGQIVKNFSEYSLIVTDSNDKEFNLTYYPWDQWFYSYDRGAREEGLPKRATIRPNGELSLDPIPDDAYSVRLIKTSYIDVLDEDADVPVGLPAAYHDIIVWRAIQYYAEYHQDLAMLSKAQRMFDLYHNRLETNEKKQISLVTDQFYNGGYS